jgi:hypothetical protein
VNLLRHILLEELVKPERVKAYNALTLLGSYYMQYSNKGCNHSIMPVLQIGCLH